MRFPLTQAANMATYIAKNKIRPKPEWQQNLAMVEDSKNPFRIVHTQIPSAGAQRKPHPMINKRFPLVMMLEPLHACNLTCTGCGRIREYETSVSSRLTLDQCLTAVDECGAPMISICGGEPFLYPELPQLGQRHLKRGRYIQLCTNGMFLTKKLDAYKPDAGLVLNVHLDGLEKNHDLAVEREGVFKTAIEGIKHAKSKGFRVFTNTTVYRETDMNEIWQMFELLETLGVDGHTISPAYGYSSVNDQELFMTREDVHEKFKDIEKMSKRFPLVSSPVYQDFLKGERDLPCTAWGNPTYNVKGWKGPCYLITDAHHDTFEDLMTKTPWENYGHGNDPRCDQCMVHCGYEPSAAYGINAKLSDPFKTLSWLLGLGAGSNPNAVKPALVTGATGFVGWHVARALLDRGEPVRVLARNPSALRDLGNAQPYQGDLRDPASLQRAVEGCGTVFHVAADYRLWTREPLEMHRSNVDGTHAMLEAACKAGVERFVYTSTVGCIAVPEGGLGDETMAARVEDMQGPYKQTKLLAEHVALKFASEGFPVVIVNPTAPVGDHDFKPTPTGKIIVDFVRGAMPAYLDTGLNVVDVRDVAAGHLAARERGRVGERYILGAENMTLRQIFEALSPVAGRKPPAMEIPYAVAYAAGVASTAWANVTGMEPRAPLDGVKMARKKMWVRHEKAAQELGYTPGSASQALSRAVEWFRGNGYC